MRKQMIVAGTAGVLVVGGFATFASANGEFGFLQGLFQTMEEEEEQVAEDVASELKGLEEAMEEEALDFATDFAQEWQAEMGHLASEETAEAVEALETHFQRMVESAEESRDLQLSQFEEGLSSDVEKEVGDMKEELEERLEYLLTDDENSEHPGQGFDEHPVFGSND